MKDYVRLAEELAEAYWAKKIAEEVYEGALEAYRATNPAPGSVEQGGVKITRTKDTVRKTFNKDRMIGVYGKAEYDRFVEERPQAGSIRISVLTPEDNEGGF